jgi:hypothetical protein
MKAINWILKNPGEFVKGVCVANVIASFMLCMYFSKATMQNVHEQSLPTAIHGR